MTMRRGILLVGNRFLPIAHEGDKTFWLQMARHLLEHFETVHVLSIMEPSDQITAPDQGYRITTVKPVRLPLSGLNQRERFNAESARISDSQSYLSRTMTIPRMTRAISQICRRETIELVHFMDNYGPASFALKPNGIPATITEMSYNRRLPFYDQFLKLSLEPFDGIVTHTEAFGKRLADLGISASKLFLGKLGCEPRTVAERERLRRDVRERLGLDDSSPVVLWSGYLQQMQYEDFQFARLVAVEALERDAELNFVFDFKPVHFKSEYMGLGKERLLIQPDGFAFDELLVAADAFLSPYVSRHVIAGPPLTWIQALSSGVPIITSDIPAATEIVENGAAGFICKSVPEFVESIVNLSKNPEVKAGLREKSVEIWKREYTLESSVATYMHAWETVLSS